MLPLYERIDKLCKDNGTNITQMCKEAGVQRSALSDYKSGKNKTISFANLQKIADYFNMTVDELVKPRLNDLIADAQRRQKEQQKKDEITFDDFTYAMYDHAKDLTEDEKKMLLEMAEFMKKKRGL